MSTLSNAGTSGSDNTVIISLNFGQSVTSASMPVPVISMTDVKTDVSRTSPTVDVTAPATENKETPVQQSVVDVQHVVPNTTEAVENRQTLFKERRTSVFNAYEVKPGALLGESNDKIAENMRSLFFTEHVKMLETKTNEELDGILANLDRLLTGMAVFVEATNYVMHKKGTMVHVQKVNRNCLILSCTSTICTVFDFATSASCRVKAKDCSLIKDLDIKPFVATIDVELLSESDAAELKELNAHP